MPIRTIEVPRGLALRVPPWGSSFCLVSFMPRATHSGHWNPTEPGTMHWGQIGRSHRWHLIRVCLSGCRWQVDASSMLGGYR